MGSKGFIPIPHSSHSAPFKDMDVFVAIQGDACPDYQASSAVIIDFSDIEGQVVGPWFSPCESTVKITGYA
ncbi:hypothetical protein TNCV_3474581 [Trichonephila clavipes]|nr:hypothetical protein TNCV_3474581 [Trichonephila clavipes]